MLAEISLNVTNNWKHEFLNGLNDLNNEFYLSFNKY